MTALYEICPSCTWREEVELNNGVCPQCDTNWHKLQLQGELAALQSRLEQAEAESEARRLTLIQKSDELRNEWIRAERAEAEVERLKREYNEEVDKESENGK
jgi:hypothetical protein